MMDGAWTVFTEAIKTVTRVWFPVGSNQRPENWYLLLSYSTFSIKRQCEAYTACGRQVAAWLEDRKVPLLSPGQSNLVNKT